MLTTLSSSFKMKKFCLIRLNRLIGQNYPCMNRIKLQPTGAQIIILVYWLEWLTAKQVIWVQSLVEFIYIDTYDEKTLLFSCFFQSTG